jgi:hypothetical protein
MMLNRILISGVIQILDTGVYSPQAGVCTDLSLFTRDWWQDRKDNSHMFTVVVRVPANLLEVESPLEDGMLLLVEGRLNRWSGGTEYDNRQAVTGVEAERLLILHEPPGEPRRASGAVASDGSAPVEVTEHEGATRSTPQSSQ